MKLLRLCLLPLWAAASHLPAAAPAAVKAPPPAPTPAAAPAAAAQPPELPDSSSAANPKTPAPAAKLSTAKNPAKPPPATPEETAGSKPVLVAIPNPDPAKLPKGRVLLELCENGLPDKNAWPAEALQATETAQAEAFGLFDLPHRYTDTGVRADRANPLFLRASARVRIPAGTHRLLLRGRGAAALFIDGVNVLTNPFPPGSRDDMSPVKQQEKFLNLGPDFRFAPPGNRESWTEFTSQGGDHVVVLETIVGGYLGKARRRPELGETVAAISLQGRQDWELLSPGSERVAYDDKGWETYRARTAHALEATNQHLRSLARAEHIEYWQRRRDAATLWLSSTPEVEVPRPTPNAPAFNPVDHFLNAKLATFASQTTGTRSGSLDFFNDILPILESRCMDCHKGAKVKGALRLDLRETALKGGESGKPAVVPHKPAESELLHRILSTDPDEVMPPKGDRIPPAQAELLKRWIAEGAHWPQFRALPTGYTPLSDDLTFLRRVSLDVLGLIPTAAEAEAFLADTLPDKRARLIDRLLLDPRAPEHGIGYWQDVLAENPNILNPTLNNTGPFRWWILESLQDRKPLDLMVTELVRMRGSQRFGGPAGFGVASQNDVPMAAKGTVLGAAFLGVEMKCARCHDAPAHRFKQEQLFQLGAMLGGNPLKVPATSSVPMDKLHSGARKALIEVTLKPGATVPPAWPFPEFVDPSVGDWLAQDPENQADRLAALLTAPHNERFAQVMANRIWARLMGRGLVEPLADWENGVPTHPELLRWLGRELVRSGFDANHLARLILNSHAYQRCVLPTLREPSPLYNAPSLRRLTAEQVVDSLVVATGKALHTEEASLDIDSIRDLGNSISLGMPTRAWMFTSTSNERDRPSLALPRLQAVADVLSAFGWRASRQDPASARDHAANLLQPAILGNGVMATWLTVLSDDHGFTELACQTPSLARLVDVLFLKTLTRFPTPEERDRYTALLAPGFEQRLRTPETPTPPAPDAWQKRRPSYYVSWSNHLHADATRIRLEQEADARKGDPPSPRLAPEWRERLEDALWTLLNSPSFVFTP